MHFSLVKVFPEGVHYTHGFDDVILPIKYALVRLGYEVETMSNALNPHSVNILFGTCRVPDGITNLLPANSIIFNLEQMTTSNRWSADEKYINHLRQFTVWDYSHRNARYLRRTLGLENVVEIRLGYVPEMTRLAAEFPKDIDVLFYGSQNERRKKILDNLKDLSPRLEIVTGLYGRERDLAISRAKVILNIHAYSPASLEVPRLGYLWANRQAVVSERDKYTEMYDGLETACCYRSYEQLIDGVREMLADDQARIRQAEEGFRTFSQYRLEDVLEAVLGRRSHAAAAGPVPRRLNAGSGKDFQTDCLNIDILPRANPDLVLDLSQPLDHQAEHDTKRFGPVTLKPGAFTHISAIELLEHVKDLPRIMDNFLALLADGGELYVTVPYELSLGASQDPTHVRYFNENSWWYFTKWAWYMGWREHCFDLVSLEYDLSELGQAFAAKGLAMEEILRIPRAVDGMKARLRKRQTTTEEKKNFDLSTRSFYDGPVDEWAVR